jgi:hypothetical protein
MTKITNVEIDKQGRAVKVFTEGDDGSKSEILLSSDFCHLCINDLAEEFSKFMKEKGHPIVQGKG